MNKMKELVKKKMANKSHVIKRLCLSDLKKMNNVGHSAEIANEVL